MRSLATLLVALFVLVSTASADKWSRKANRQQRQNQGWTVVESPTVVSTTPVVRASESATQALKGVEDAMPEVNAARAALGLPPLAVDPLLCKAAYACAQQRAARFIHGHLPESDFSYVSGTSASVGGCGALEDSWGWGTCAYRDTQYRVAGAAWVRGSDGLRYMHFFAR